MTVPLPHHSAGSNWRAGPRRGARARDPTSVSTSMCCRQSCTASTSTKAARKLSAATPHATTAGASGGCAGGRAATQRAPKGRAEHGYNLLGLTEYNLNVRRHRTGSCGRGVSVFQYTVWDWRHHRPDSGIVPMRSAVPPCGTSTTVAGGPQVCLTSLHAGDAGGTRGCHAILPSGSTPHCEDTSRAVAVM